MDGADHATSQGRHAYLYVFMLMVGVGCTSLALMSGPHSRSGLTLQSIFALGGLAAAIGLVAAILNRRSWLVATSIAVTGAGLLTLMLMTVIPRPGFEPLLLASGAWTAGPIPLSAGWADIAMALVLAACGAALAFARAPDLATQVIALTIVRAALWIDAFWQLAYVTLDGDFTHLFNCPASLTFQIGLVVAIVVSGGLMLRGDRRWLATLTGVDNSLVLPRYILPLALAPVIGAYVIGLGARSKAYDLDAALLLNVEFVSILLVLVCSAGVRVFWGRRQAREDRAHALQEAPVIVLSADGRIEYWPRECERMFGFAAEEALGSHTPSLLRTQYPQPLDEIVEALRAEGRWVGVVRHMTRDGRLLRIASTIAMHHPTGDGEAKVVATMTDITDVET